MTVMPDPNRPFGVTESAAKRIAVLREEEGGPDTVMRVAVLGGGCSGFQYQFSFDQAINDDNAKKLDEAIKGFVANLKF